jgi:CHAT domain-containing protein
VREISQQLMIPAAQLLIGDAATKAAVVEKSKNARLLYFATHGIASEEDPLDGSGLFLTPAATGQTGLWTAREIQSMKLAAELVILSACQTGLGATQDAGVIGLSRAFHLAGAKSVVTSLWSVDDLATKELMKTSMEKLQEPHHFFPAAHLRRAMLAFRAENPSPYYWAAFAVMGIA